VKIRRNLCSVALGLLLYGCFGLCYSEGQLADGVCVKHIRTPTYPRLAWFAQLTGNVDVDVEVDSDGKVRSASATGAHKLLNEALEKNVSEWTFSSSSQSARLKITFVYRLDGKKEVDQSPPIVLFDLPNRVEIVARPPQPQP